MLGLQIRLMLITVYVVSYGGEQVGEAASGASLHMGGD
jgi:hypothetical protein